MHHASCRVTIAAIDFSQLTTFSAEWLSHMCATSAFTGACRMAWTVSYKTQRKEMTWNGGKINLIRTEPNSLLTSFGQLILLEVDWNQIFFCVCHHLCCQTYEQCGQFENHERLFVCFWFLTILIDCWVFAASYSQLDEVSYIFDNIFSH